MIIINCIIGWHIDKVTFSQSVVLTQPNIGWSATYKLITLFLTHAAVGREDLWHV
jgi:hypothetical protein